MLQSCENFFLKCLDDVVDNKRITNNNSSNSSQHIPLEGHMASKIKAKPGVQRKVVSGKTYTVQSLRGLIDNENVKRTDTYLVNPLIVGIEEDFNVRVTTDPELRSHIDSIKESIRLYIGRENPENKVCHDGLGEVFPPLVVRVTEDGAILVVDGHCRETAIRELVADEGYDISLVYVKQTRENAAGRIGIMLRSSFSKDLSPYEKAIALTRLADNKDENGEPISDEPMSFPQISRFIGGSISPQRVEQLVLLGRAPQKVRELVADKEIVADTAIEILRKHRDNPAEAERIIVELVASKDRGRVGKALTRPSVPRKAAEGIYEVISRDAKVLKKQVDSIIKAAGEGDWEQESVTVTLPAGIVKQLLDQQAKAEAKPGAAEGAE